MSVSNALRLTQRKALSPAWLRFARSIVEQIGVQDQESFDILVQALASVPRDQFMPEALRQQATQDHAFPIGYGQTISKPTTVARMLAVAQIRPGMKVLEIGCGSGYCSAVIAALGADVFAIEYIGFLARATRKRLDSLGLHTILIKSGDGRKGWLEHAPYDAIIMSAAFDVIDPELIAQLVRPGGMLVAPVGDSKSQKLHLIIAKEKEFVRHELEECRFVEGQ